MNTPNFDKIKTILDYKFDERRLKESLFISFSIFESVLSEDVGSISNTMLKLFYKDYDTHLKLLEQLNSLDIMMGYNDICFRIIVNPIISNIVENRNKDMLFAFEKELRKKYSGSVVDYSILEEQDNDIKEHKIKQKIFSTNLGDDETTLLCEFYTRIFCDWKWANVDIPPAFEDCYYKAPHFCDTFDAVTLLKHLSNEEMKSLPEFLESEFVIKLTRKRRKGLIKWLNEQAGEDVYTENNLSKRIIQDGFYKTMEDTPLTSYMLPEYCMMQYKNTHLKQYQSILAVQKVYNIYPAHPIIDAALSEEKIMNRALSIACLTIPVIDMRTYLSGFGEMNTPKEGIDKAKELRKLNPYVISKIVNYEEFFTGFLHIFYELLLQEEICLLAKNYIILRINELKDETLERKKNKNSQYKEIIDGLNAELQRINEENAILKQKALFNNYSATTSKTDKKLHEKIRILENDKKKLEAEIKQQESNNEELYRLREYYYTKEQAEENKGHITDYEVEQFMNATYSNCFVFIGGRYETLGILKSVFPNAKFLETETANVEFDWSSVEKCFFFYKNMNHPLFYKTINVVREKNVPFEYIGNKNIKLVYSMLKEHLQKNLKGDDCMRVTQHAEQRLRERCGFNRKTSERMAKRAFDNGIPHCKTKGQLNKWITSLYMKNKNANNIRLYGDMVYIFCDGTLVTVMHIPYSLRKNKEQMIRN